MSDPLANIDEKDIKISNLEAQIFEMEQSDKSYTSLSHKYKDLQNRYNEMIDEKQSNELEHNVKLNNYKAKIEEVKREHTTATHELETKIRQNQQLYTDLASISSELEAKLAEIAKLRDKHNVDLSKLSKAEELLMERESTIRKKDGIIAQLQLDLESQKRVSESLNKRFCESQNRLLSNENERFNEESKVDKLTLEVRDLKEKIDLERIRADNNKNLYTEKETECRLREKEIRELNSEINMLRGELERLKDLGNKGVTEKERLSQAFAKEQRNVELLKREIQKGHEVRAEFEGRNKKLLDDNTTLLDELEKANYHLRLLDEMNDRLTAELNSIVDQDESIKDCLDRKSKLNRMVESNKVIVSSSAGFSTGTSKFTHYA